MAKGRNRNNQSKNRPEEVEKATDAEFLDSDDQADAELDVEEDQVTIAEESVLQEDVGTDDTPTEDTKPDSDVDFEESPPQATSTVQSNEPKKKSSNAVWYGVAAILIAAAVGGVYYSNQSDDTNNGSVEATRADEDNPSDASDVVVYEEEDNNSDAASSDDVINHQTDDDENKEALSVDQASESDNDDLATADDETDTKSIDERDAEESAAITPEVGIGAFEQEELATGEKDSDDLTSMDEPNAEKVAGAEEEETEASSTNDSDTDESSTNDVEAEESSVNDVDDEEFSVNDSEAVESSTNGTEAEEFAANSTETQESSTNESEDTTDSESEQDNQNTTETETASSSDTNQQGATEQAPQTIIIEPDPEAIAELEREFEVLTASQQQEIQRLQQELANMQAHIQSTNASAESLLLNDVSRLLQSADNELRFNGNVANAVSILTVAQRLTAESKNRMLEGLVGAIGADIVALKSNESATTEEMFKQVQYVANLITNAPLNTPDYASHNKLMTPTVEKTESKSSDSSVSNDKASDLDADTKWYVRTWNGTKSFANQAYSAVASDLGDLVRVEKLSEPDSGLLSAEQAGVMRNNLKMQLGFAQQALMSKHQEIWQTSLMTVHQALEQYFRADAAETVQASRLLSELAQLSVQPSMPDISHSRRAIAETYEQLRVQQSFQE